MQPIHKEQIIRIQAQTGWSHIDLIELWRYRELIGFLAMRDIKVLYKQSILGIVWVVAQPLMTLVVFSTLFGILLGRDGKPTLEGVPYAISTFCALVPWQYFARSLTLSGNSLVSNQQLITKVYFPRMVAPIAGITAPIVDFFVAFTILIGMMIFYGIMPTWKLVFIPVFIVFSMLTALSISLWSSAMNAIYRDVRHMLPFIVQMLMYISPVIYTTENIMASQPEWVRILYGMNPMAGVIEGFRWCLLGAINPQWQVMGASFVAVMCLLIAGMYYFRRMERIFADVV
ncbi:MAG: hypothetical protein A3H98_10550 [Bacteroidetes bacterium RIFCSPLOWO2_02_FULL_36_8]|nr:MAG: hypothetical protein A3H98_10550 [Bacteroidetes bacterium RIFCSPLOWO2_02_FULL_36_8]